MARRIHVRDLFAGEIPLDAAQAHHARHVLRLTDGTAVEAFDDAGGVAAGVLVLGPAGDVSVRVDRIDTPGAADWSAAAGVQLTVAAAVPKGDRADWMVEKLSELGAAAFVPLAAARSVVLPEGKNKRDRWVRIATEAAKQSRRAGVMRVGELTPLADALRAVAGSAGAAGGGAAAATAWYLATEAHARPAPVGDAVRDLTDRAALTAFVGPEGGWTDEERRRFEAAGARAVRLTTTVLRVETAAVAVAALVGSLALDAPRSGDDHRTRSPDPLDPEPEIR